MRLHDSCTVSCWHNKYDNMMCGFRRGYAVASKVGQRLMLTTMVSFSFLLDFGLIGPLATLGNVYVVACVRPQFWP